MIKKIISIIMAMSLMVSMCSMACNAEVRKMVPEIELEKLDLSATKNGKGWTEQVVDGYTVHIIRYERAYQLYQKLAEFINNEQKSFEKINENRLNKEWFEKTYKTMSEIIVNFFNGKKEEALAALMEMGNSANGAAVTTSVASVSSGVVAGRFVANKLTQKAIEKAGKEAAKKTTEVAVEKVAKKVTEKAIEKVAEKVTEKAVEKAAEKATEKAVEKIAEKATEVALDKVTKATINATAVGAGTAVAGIVMAGMGAVWNFYQINRAENVTYAGRRYLSVFDSLKYLLNEYRWAGNNILIIVIDNAAKSLGTDVRFDIIDGLQKERNVDDNNYDFSKVRCKFLKDDTDDCRKKSMEMANCLKENNNSRRLCDKLNKAVELK